MHTFEQQFIYCTTTPVQNTQQRCTIFAHSTHRIGYPNRLGPNRVFSPIADFAKRQATRAGDGAVVAFPISPPTATSTCALAYARPILRTSPYSVRRVAPSRFFPIPDRVASTVCRSVCLSAQCGQSCHSICLDSLINVKISIVSARLLDRPV
jgi:hypothetical protein